MKHVPSCGCVPHRPPPPCPTAHVTGNGVLLDRVIACEKRVIPRLCTVLEAFGLPECASPFRLIRVLPSIDPPTWSIPGDSDHCGHLPVCLSIPVRLVLCDSCGRSHTASASVDVETWPPHSFLEGWGTELRIMPCIRLLCGECLSCDTRFEVQLHVALDLYLLRPEVFHMNRPACPELPLYPPPIHH